MIKNRKATLDDGMNPEMVLGADFDGYLGIPTIHRPDQFIIPKDIVPFTKRGRIPDSGIAIGFYEMDEEFSDVLISPGDYIEELPHMTIKVVIIGLIKSQWLLPKKHLKSYQVQFSRKSEANL